MSDQVPWCFSPDVVEVIGVTEEEIGLASSRGTHCAPQDRFFSSSEHHHPSQTMLSEVQLERDTLYKKVEPETTNFLTDDIKLRGCLLPFHPVHYCISYQADDLVDLIH